MEQSNAKKVYIKISWNCPFNWIPCSGGLVLFIIRNGGERCAYVEPAPEVSACRGSLCLVNKVSAISKT
jgi:hypothetical protein